MVRFAGTGLDWTGREAGREGAELGKAWVGVGRGGRGGKWRKRVGVMGMVGWDGMGMREWDGEVNKSGRDEQSN